MAWTNYKKLKDLSKEHSELHLIVDENLDLGQLTEFHNLKKLCLKGGVKNLATIPSQIKQLEIYLHALDEVDIIHTNLERLIIKTGPLKKIALDTPNLKSINLNQNQLTELPNMSSLKNLLDIYIQTNHIDFLDFTKIPKQARRIYLKGNNIASSNLEENQEKVKNLISLDY